MKKSMLTRGKGYKTKVISGLLMIALLSMSLSGCGKKEQQGAADQAAGKAGEVTYIAEAFSVPQTHINAGTVFENTVYFLNQEDGMTGTTAQSIYRLDLGAESSTPAAVAIAPEQGSMILHMAADVSGNLNLISAAFEEGGTGVITDLTWLKADANGDPAGSVALTSFLTEHDGQMPIAFQVDQAGNAYLVLADTIYVLDPQGNALYDVKCDGIISNLSRSAAGTIYVVWVNTQTTSMVGMADINSDTQAMGTKHDVPLTEVVMSVSPGTGDEMILSSASGVYRYDTKNKTLNEIFKWSSVDVASDYYGLSLPAADGRFLWLDRDYGVDGSITSALSMVRPLREGEAAPEPKEIITFGGISIFIDANIRTAIVNFNQTNPDYRVELVEYGADDLVAGMEQMNADIASGNAPDIMALPMSTSMNAYADKGVLEDLYTYLDQDEELKREDLQENIIRAFESDGKLYGIPVSFMVMTVIGDATKLGTDPSWSLDEMIAYVEQNGEGKQMFMDHSKSGVLTLCVEGNRDLLVNWDNAEEGFDREIFIKMLEFANQFTPDDQYTPDDTNALFEKLSTGEIQFAMMPIMSLETYQVYNGLFGGDTVFKGLPTDSGSGSLASSTALIAISGKSAHKEAAWEFVRSMLSPEFQEASGQLFGFPVRKSALEKLFTDILENNEETGDEQEQSVNMGSAEINIHQVREEEVQAIRSLIDSVDKMMESDEQITNIITEEAQTYFSGSKTAEQAADVVENRLQTYIKEMQ